MTDSLYPTEKIIRETDIAINALGYAGTNAVLRIHLLGWRNKLKGRVAHLEGRLTTADEKFPHTELDGMPHTDLYLDLMHQYVSAYDALHRADAAL